MEVVSGIVTCDDHDGMEIVTYDDHVVEMGTCVGPEKDNDSFEIDVTPFGVIISITHIGHHKQCVERLRKLKLTL